MSHLTTIFTRGPAATERAPGNASITDAEARQDRDAELDALAEEHRRSLPTCCSIMFQQNHDGGNVILPCRSIMRISSGRGSGGRLTPVSLRHAHRLGRLPKPLLCTPG